MPRIRSPERDKAFELYKNSGGALELVRIADELGVPEGTVRGWKNKDKWEQQLNGTFQTKKRNTPKKKKGGQPKNKNAVGHGAPPENKNAEKHGFFSKWLPAETMEIMQEIEEKSPADILWEQITLQYTAIIRAQRLMYVRDQKDKTTEIVSSSDMGTSWEYQQAWDKHEKFLSAQSRAMTTLNGLIKQYEEMLHSADDAAERKARLEKLRLESARIKAETDRINADKGSGIGSVVFAGEGDLID